jgi:uncharacterized protein (TIGR03083 family)
MTTTSPTARGRIAAVNPLRHRDWMTASEVEYRRIGALLADLGEDDWTSRTDCPDWNVRDLVAHLVGNAEMSASMREMRRQQKLGRRLRPDGPEIDGMTAVQVHERADVPPEKLLRDLADVAPRAVRARGRIPAPVRAIPIPFGPPLGTRPLGYLMGRIYTRDAWMHRIDLARATGRPLELTPEHDGRIVADVVAEWAREHRQPYRLTLTGPAGGAWSSGAWSSGAWSSGADGEEITLDAVEFCRILSGRATGTGLLTQEVTF